MAKSRRTAAAEIAPGKSKPNAKRQAKSKGKRSQPTGSGLKSAQPPQPARAALQSTQNRGTGHATGTGAAVAPIPQSPRVKKAVPSRRRELPDLVQRAISFAARAHAGQLRRDGITPYAAHPMRALFTVSQLFGIDDPEVHAAAALHDVVEDTPVRREDIAAEFSEPIAELVILLTKNERLPQPERDDCYYAELAQASWRARALKLADAYDNLLDSAASRRGPRAKRLKIARRCLAELVRPRESRLRRAATLLQQLVDRLDPAA